VTIGPTCPVETEGSPCDDLPYEATLIILDQAGSEVATVESDAEGLFSAPLPPGEYTIVPQSPNSGSPPYAEEQKVVVASGRLTRSMSPTTAASADD
jgi:hypothetical protein